MDFAQSRKPRISARSVFIAVSFQFFCWICYCTSLTVEEIVPIVTEYLIIWGQMTSASAAELVTAAIYIDRARAKGLLLWLRDPGQAAIR